MSKRQGYESSVLRKLRGGEYALGSWINTASPIVGELMGGCGFDFLTVDVEHSAVDLADIQSIFQGVRSANPNCDCFVRSHGADYSFTKRYLDSGANGIICPLVESAEDVKVLVDATKFPPEGRRGVGFCRANQYGNEVLEYVGSANNETLLAVQIESKNGVDRIDEILGVPGVDAVFIGPYDLSASMGITAQFEHPDYLEARQKVLDACKRYGVAPGIHVVQPDPDEAIARIGDGYQMVAYSLDITMLQNSCRKGLDAIRSKV